MQPWRTRDPPQGRRPAWAEKPALSPSLGEDGFGACAFSALSALRLRRSLSPPPPPTLSLSATFSFQPRHWQTRL